MCRLNKYNLTFSTVCVVSLLSLSSVAVADGDPMELLMDEVSVQEKAGTLLPDEQVAPPEEAVATVTADGDFLLPTYLLPGETATVERTTTVEKVYEKTPSKMKTITIPVTKETVVSQKTTTTTVEPDDFAELLKQTAPAPVSSVSQTVTVRHEPQTVIPVETKVPVVIGETSVAQAQPKRKLLIPLASVPKVEMPEAPLPAKERIIIPSKYAEQMSESLKNGSQLPFKMPHEIRITFYPGASAFSGQTLKWIRAFAMAAIQDPRLIVEVRASCAEADLQDERLKLVKGVLTGVGLSTHQILVNYTDRPVDTMLLRAVQRPQPTETVLTRKDIKLPKSMSRVQKW